MYGSHLDTSQRFSKNALRFCRDAFISRNDCILIIGYILERSVNSGVGIPAMKLLYQEILFEPAH